MCSYYCWSISQPGKTGTPSLDLTDDPEAQVENPDNHNCVKLAYERIIRITFNHYAIPLKVTDVILATFRAKLYRMGKHFSMLGGQQQQHQLSQWKDGTKANWSLTTNETEVNNQSML